MFEFGDVLVCVHMFKCICMSWACVYICMDIYMAVHGNGLEHTSAYVCVHRHTNGCLGGVCLCMQCSWV